MTTVGVTAEADAETEALAWLVRRVRWERRLTELRENVDTTEVGDDAEVDEAA